MNKNAPKRIYIDLENVGPKGLKGINRLTEKDSVFLYYGKYNPTPKFDITTVNLLLKAKCNVRFISVNKKGKNAVDNQVINDIIRSIQKGLRFYIISNDNDFKKTLSGLKNVSYRNRIERI